MLTMAYKVRDVRPIESNRLYVVELGILADKQKTRLTLIEKSFYMILSSQYEK